MPEDVTGKRVEERGEPAVRTLAMPADTNPSGDIFGGWVLAQMDLAAGIVASQRAKGRVATAALDGMSFHKPVYVGDLVSCHARVVRIGRTSMTVRIDVWAERGAETIHVTEAEGVFVGVDLSTPDRKPVLLFPEGAPA